MKFEGVTVLVIGDVMLDHYITGKASRISPEAPVPVVNRQSAWMVPGGAANVACGLARLGCTARLVGFAAEDASGLALRQKLAATGVEAYLVPGRNRLTICKTRILVGGQQLLRIDEETVTPPVLPERIALIHALDQTVDQCDAIILSDYAKGVLLRDQYGQSLCQVAINKARDKGIPVLIDPKGTDWIRYEGASCITPNLAEFHQICSTISNDWEACSSGVSFLAAQICEKFSLERLLLTRGPEGMELFEKGSQVIKLPASVREVSDVSGAGDTVIATLAACVAKGLSWEESAAIANTAAGIAVSKIGATPVELSELNNALEKDQKDSKIYSLSGLLEVISQWRSEGKRIVFTNGCFDLLHPGHISLLHESASLGDKLIVGLNSDASIARLKGAGRPIQAETNRARVLAALEDVDAIVVFAEDTPELLLSAIRPDVLVKGGDYQIENVVGADFVKSYGGKLHLARFLDGHSTSALVGQMRDKKSF